jgi:hypothetical protein
MGPIQAARSSLASGAQVAEQAGRAGHAGIHAAGIETPPVARPASKRRPRGR